MLNHVAAEQPSAFTIDDARNFVKSEPGAASEERTKAPDDAV